MKETPTDKHERVYRLTDYALSRRLLAVGTVVTALPRRSSDNSRYLQPREHMPQDQDVDGYPEVSEGLAWGRGDEQTAQQGENLREG